MEQYIGKYLGPRQIKEVVLIDQKTPLGNKIYTVVYEDGYEEIITASALDLCVKDVITDFSILQKAKLNMVVQKMIEVIAEYNIQMYEFEMVSKLLNESIGKSMDKAMSYRWYGSLKEYIEGKDPVQFITILEIDKFLKEADANNTDVPLATPGEEPKVDENA